MQSKRTALILLLLVLASRPARAQVDLAGEWSPRVYNTHMDIGDYTGIPINEAGRLRAESWHPDQLDLPENLCRPHPIDIGLRVSVPGPRPRMAGIADMMMATVVIKMGRSRIGPALRIDSSAPRCSVSRT